MQKPIDSASWTGRTPKPQSERMEPVLVFLRAVIAGGYALLVLGGALLFVGITRAIFLGWTP